MRDPDSWTWESASLTATPWDWESEGDSSKLCIKWRQCVSAPHQEATQPGAAAVVHLASEGLSGSMWGGDLGHPQLEGGCVPGSCLLLGPTFNARCAEGTPSSRTGGPHTEGRVGG